LDDGASWTKLQSITQQRDLDEFLSTAQLAGTQFTAGNFSYFVIYLLTFNWKEIWN